MSACDCGSWDGGHQGDCSLFRAAPESQPLTEAEQDEVFAAYRDGLLRPCQAVFLTVERILATRTAALLDRLKAAEVTAEQIRVIDEMARDDADSRVAFELQRAEADKARAVAEARGALLDEVEAWVSDQANWLRDNTGKPWPMVDVCGVRDRARALREEVSGQ